MSSPRALFRLGLRPMGLVYLYFVVMAVGFPVLRLEDLGGNPFVTLWTEAALPLVQSARWQLAVLVPASLGLYTLLLRLEVMTSGLGWMLPGVRRGWLAGELMVLAPLAVGLGLLAAQGTTVAVGAAAAGVALVAFNLPSLILQVWSPKWLGPSSLALLVGGAVFPAQLGAAGAAVPVFVAVLAVPAVLVMLRVRYSDWAARGSVTWGAADGEREWMLERSNAHGEWNTSLATDHRTPWLRAVIYEAGFGSTSRTVKMRSIGVSVLLIMTYVFMDYSMLIFWAGMVAGSERTDGLTGGLLYPVSREDRGRILATALVLDAAFTLILLIGGAWLLDALPLPLERSHFSPDRNIALGVIAATAVALLPIALWGRVRHMSARRLTAATKGQLTSFLCLLGFALIAVLVIRPLQGAWDAGSYALVVGSLSLSAIVLYPLFWYTTLRYYRRRDLVRAD